MGWTDDGNRRKLLRRLLHLWNMVPDDTFSQVISEVFSLKAMALENMGDEQVFSRLNDLIEGKTEMIYLTKLHTVPPPMADNISAWVDFSPNAYAKAHLFLDELKQHVRELSRADYAEIKKLALSSNIDRAKHELARILQESDDAKTMKNGRRAT